MSPFLSPLERLNSQVYKKNDLIHWTLFCCRPASPGDQAVQDGGGLLVFRAQGAEGQHGEGFTHHGFKEHRGQSRPAGSAAERGFSSGAGRETSTLLSSSACPLLFLLFLLPLSTLGQRYQFHQQFQQKQQRRHGNYNSFSPTCHLGEEGELLCDQCQPGYTGPRCDR